MPDFELLKPLISPQYQTLFALYCRFWKMGWQHFTRHNLSSAIKEQQLMLLEKAIRKPFPLKNNLLARLQQLFVRENLSPSLLLDLLPAWRYLAADKAPASETLISDIIGYAVSPLARLMMVLNNEPPSTYLPMQSLLCAWLWHQLLMQKNPLLQKVRLNTKRKNSKLYGLLKNAAVLLTIVNGKQLKFQTAMLINRLNVMISNNKQARPSSLDEVKIFLYSVYQFMVVRKRTLTQKGI